jgi:hypothetical protein
VRAALILTPGLAASREFDHAWAEGQYIDAAGWLVVGTGEMLLFAVSLGQSQTINAAVRGAMTSTAVVATTGEQVVTGAARGAASLAERAAAAGVRYPRQAEQALAMTRQQLQSSAMAFTENIAKHQGFLKNPQAHVPNWNQLSRQHQQNLIHHWKSDIARAEAYRDIAEAVLGGIFK